MLLSNTTCPVVDNFIFLSRTKSATLIFSPLTKYDLSLSASTNVSL